MDIKKLEERAQEIAKQIEQSAANHHTLLGRLSEIQNVMNVIQESAEVVKEVIGEVVPNCT